MSKSPDRSPATAREAVTFWLKLAAYLVGLAAFGFVIFWLTRSLGIPH
ncbi:MAG: hypothetical protein JF593_04325 [Novosphingobium sp.]|nr:hypothetical protein [Novosphingobium sp.]